MTAALWVAAGLMVLVGIMGTILPAIPGTPLVFAGLLLAAWLDDFQKVGALMLAALAVLTLLAVAVDFLGAMLGARRAGASRQAVIGAALGTLGGLFFGIPGLIVGPFAGALIGELLARSQLPRAGAVAFATWLGLLVAALAKLVLTFFMLGLFAAAWFF